MFICLCVCVFVLCVYVCMCVYVCIYIRWQPLGRNHSDKKLDSRCLQFLPKILRNLETLGRPTAFLDVFRCERIFEWGRTAMSDCAAKSLSFTGGGTVSPLCWRRGTGSAGGVSHHEKCVIVEWGRAVVSDCAAKAYGLHVVTQWIHNTDAVD